MNSLRPGPLRRAAAEFDAALGKAAILLIRGYQIFISPLLGERCRFYPSCSRYAAEVFRDWGFTKGLCLTCRRLIKCGPWHPGGFDPPPKNNAESGMQNAE